MNTVWSDIINLRLITYMSTLDYTRCSGAGQIMRVKGRSIIILNSYLQSSQPISSPPAFDTPSSAGGPRPTPASGSIGIVFSSVSFVDEGSALPGAGSPDCSVFSGLLWRSTWPRSRVGSIMFRTSCLRCLTSRYS